MSGRSVASGERRRGERGTGRKSGGTGIARISVPRRLPFPVPRFRYLPRMPPMTAEMIAALGRIVGPRWVRHRRAELTTYAMDGLPDPGIVLRASSCMPGTRRRGARDRAAARTSPTSRSSPAAPAPDSRAARVAERRRGAHRAHPHEPHPRGGSRRGAAPWSQPGVVNARLSEAVAPLGLALRARSVEPDRLHRRRQRGRERRRAALPQVRRHHQSRRRSSRSCCPTARSSSSGSRTASPGDPTSSGSSSAAKGCSASPPQITVRLEPHAAERAHDARRLLHRPRRERGGLRRSSRPASCPRRWR